MSAAPETPIRSTDACLTLAGQRVRLLAVRGAYWEDARTLIVADLHLGKCEAFGALGVPLPAGLLEKQLATLREGVLSSGAVRVVVVGDLLHAPAGLTRELVGTVASWRETIDAEIVVVPGNHDRKLETVAEEWGIRVSPPRWTEGPFAFEHIRPRDVPGTYLWSGHFHPAVWLRAGGDALKLPCFHVGRGSCVLPAFSQFTAGGPLTRRPGDRVFAVAHDRVLEV